MPSFQEKSPLKSEELQQSTVYQDFLLPFHYFFDRSKKSEPIPNQEKVRISFVSWRLRDSIADFALEAKSYGDSQFLNWLLRYATGISH